MENKANSTSENEMLSEPKTAQSESMNENNSSKSKRGLIIGIIALVMMIAAASIAYGVLTSAEKPASSPTSSQAIVGSSSSANVTSNSPSSITTSSLQEAPDITIVDKNGEEIALSSLFGKPIILNFWASTCGPCQSEMPDFQEEYEQHGDEIQFVMVDIPGFLGETKTRADAFLNQNEYTFPVYFDDNNSATIAYGITSIPRTYFINEERLIVMSQMGTIGSSSLEYGIRTLLAE